MLLKKEVRVEYKVREIDFLKEMHDEDEILKMVLEEEKEAGMGILVC